MPACRWNLPTRVSHCFMLMWISMCCCWLYRRWFASGRRRKCKLTVPCCFKLTIINMDNSATSPLAYVVCMFTHHCSPSFYSKRSACVAERKKKFTPYLNHIWTNTLMMWECVRTEVFFVICLTVLTMYCVYGALYT